MTTTTKKPKKYHLFIYDLTEEQKVRYSIYRRNHGRTRYILKIGDPAYREPKRNTREYYKYRSKMGEDLLKGDGTCWFDAQFVWDIVHNGTKLE